ncbi:MAG: cell envelope integrity protein CreD [Candidatus Kapabacteria bacterium]|nr:cell envelope integrity protein CreD [Candidatus Kapabacteria bacterium]
MPFKSYESILESGTTNKYKYIETIKYAHFLPENLNIEGIINPEIRYRNIYEVVVYNTILNLNGNFDSPNFDEFKIKEENILWEDAFVSLGMSDLRGVQENVSLKWGQNNLSFNPGNIINDVISNGMSTKVPINISDKKVNFSLNLNINGSSNLNFVPLGKVSIVKIKSKWKTPSFDGAFLPDNRNVGDNGFVAKWEVLQLNRAFPQSFIGSIKGIDESSFGVNLKVPIDEYQKSMRSAKYAVIFISLTFLIFFFVQILNNVQIHPIQYLIVGLALCVFYTLLISISEHLKFDIAYLISSISIISMITLYAKSIFKNKILTLVLCFILAFIYIFIYIIIQMEDYSLLIGSIGLFTILGAVMYLSRKIDWYSVKTNESTLKEE